MTVYNKYLDFHRFMSWSYFAFVLSELRREVVVGFVDILVELLTITVLTFFFKGLFIDMISIDFRIISLIIL